MWDEDPRYQNAVYRFLVGSVVVLTLIVTIASIWESDWELLGHWFVGLGVIFAGLCLYAAIGWLVIHILLLATRLMRKIFHKDRASIMADSKRNK